MTAGGQGGDIIRHLEVRGRVQGVGYRAFVAGIAQDHDLAGWVRNRRDGSVEAALAGSEEVVGEVIESLRRGPPLAKVASLEVRTGTQALLDLRPRGEFFAVLPTL
ncbi:acylphosphatase [Bradyrhizobium sp. WD16]|uniref:acylphosphatase n=1 Tax=Bradyrhizobium sp. WD16 TaxID=1521768 RepID=UPI0020A29BE4|nr:acylphosphatase [Bradyrhizobium sp. WD16]UTD30556.1 acylphosphatase [Bradyrhizobium sp. WD16]